MTNTVSSHLSTAILSRELAVEAELEGKILKVNSVWPRMLGWNALDLQERNFFELVHPDDRERARHEVMDSAGIAAPLQFSTRYRHKDRSYRHISWQAAADGNILYATGLDRTDQIGPAHGSDEATFRMQKMQTVNRLSGHVAHEFNNLLQTVISSLELVRKLIEFGRTAETGRFIEKAMGSAHRAASLNECVQRFARQHSRGPEPLIISTLISSMEHLLRSALPQTITLTLDLSKNSWATRCDSGHAENAILSLALNARDHIPDGGTLSIRAIDTDVHDERSFEGLAVGQYVCIGVSAMGKGSSPGSAGRNPENSSAGTTADPATGITPAVYTFAERNGGRLVSHRQSEAAISVSLYLPRHQETRGY